MAKWLQQLESYIGGGPGGPRRVKAFRWLILIGLIGAALLLIASFLNIKTVPPTQDPAVPSAGASEDTQQAALLAAGDGEVKDPFLDIESSLETRLKEMLEQIVGVGTASVMVSVESTEETVVQLDEKTMQQLTDETDRNGAKRHITEITREGQVAMYEVSGGSQTPIVVKKLRPEIRGVLVVARGAENATVQRIIVEAVAKGLDVPTHRISVVPRKQ
ncbi:stage III sporulation protein AG [Cohnella lubricantis]|uniref:Stage III sporulation protein AG n=1 Tax=Cohnella lubricantis TaxID=2163172 RepID=A0A841T506_9BACL|nr:stage III sporulation protein AG [Cohnella lubricantis]MBB6676404.1 stage III sporulation protein AG [Cohnella lubricantis]MBP2117589.1 stage III sporulation protein AG [Cohnella lubricantis]